MRVSAWSYFTLCGVQLIDLGSLFSIGRKGFGAGDGGGKWISGRREVGELGKVEGGEGKLHWDV